MSELKMSLGQAHELEIALRKAGFSNSDVSKMAENEMICQNFLAVLRGNAMVECVKHIIDCDAEPYIPEGWSIHPEDQIQSRVTGQFEFDPSKAGLFLTDKQKVSYEIGNDLKQALEGQPVLPANVLDYLLAHPEAIPESWKGKYIFFWGTIYRYSGGYLIVRYLCWRGDRWFWSDRWLDYGWDVNFPAAVSAS